MTPRGRWAPVLGAAPTAGGLALVVPLHAGAEAVGAPAYAGTLALLPLTVALALVWLRHSRDPRTTPGAGSALRHHGRPGIGLLLAVAAAGPLAGALLAVAAGRPVVVPPLPALTETGVLALLEELLFRGVLLLLLVRLWRRWAPRSATGGAALVLALAFTAAHGPTTALAAVDRLGFALLATALVLRGGRLLPAVVLHVSSNVYWYLVRPLPLAEPLLTGVDLLVVGGGGAALLVTVGRRSAPGEAGRVPDAVPQPQERSTSRR